MRGLLFSAIVSVAACSQPESTSISEQDLHGHHGWGWGGGHGGWHDNFHRADVKLHDSSASMVQTADTSWAFAKTGAVDNTTKTVTWTITAIKGSTTPGQLVVDGYMAVENDGFADATIGNIVVNLQQQKKDSHHHDHDEWTTLSSDIADATSDDAATSAHVVASSCTEHVEIFNENTASGHLVFMDATNNTVFSLVPEKTVPARSSIPLLFSASFDNSVLKLAVGSQLQAEVIVTFGNSGEHDSAHDVDINGNGTIDADEDAVRSVETTHDVKVPQITNNNNTPKITDNASDFATSGTVSISNLTFSIGATSGTVTALFDGGASGGSVTNCAHLDSADTVSHVGGFTFNDQDGIHLVACNTEPIQAAIVCQEGAPGCGWHDGDLITYAQGGWGGDPGLDAGASLLEADFPTVYGASFGVTVGSPSGFTMSFTDADSVFAYQPSVGPFAALNGNVLDPITTASGAFGGEVLAQEFNVDVTDANVLHGSTALKFGNLHVCALAGAQSPLNGSTVRQVLAAFNTMLGGGTPVIAFSDLGTLPGDINGSFSNGTVSTWAQQHLVNGNCP